MWEEVAHQPTNSSIYTFYRMRTNMGWRYFKRGQVQELDLEEVADKSVC